MGEEPTTFEAGYAELEQLVARLQEGGLTLEESLRLFERGTFLARHCQEQLAQAALRVSQLLADGQMLEISGNAEGEGAEDGVDATA